MPTVSRLLTLAAALAAWAAAPAALADRVDAVVPLGGSAAATVDAAGDVATVGFLVTEGPARKVSIQVKRAKKSALAPDVRLVAPDGTLFDPAASGGSASAGPTSWKAKFADVPQTGLWRLEVRGADGTSGGFVATVKGKDAASAKGTLTIPLGKALDVPIVAGRDAALTVTAKRVGQALIVPQVAIVDPNGEVLEGGVPFVGSERTGALAVKAYRLPLFGRYLVRFSGASGTGGSIGYSVSVGPAKIKGTLPTASAGESAEAEPAVPSGLDGTGSRPAAGGALTYRWTQVSGPPVALSNPRAVLPTFTAPDQAGSLAFALSVAENGVLSRSAVVAVEVARRPVADAGRSAVVAPSSPVSLSGAGSLARNGRPLRHAWRQVPGDTAAVTLTGADTAAPSFTSPAGEHTLHFGLVVDDGLARSFEDVVTVRVGDASSPVADAGRGQVVPRMATVHLSGLASQGAGGTLAGAAAWTQVSGPAVALSDADTPWPSFTAPRAVADLEFEFVLGGDPETRDRVAVRVRSTETNLPAPAKGNGPLTAASGTVQLGAGATVDPDGGTLAFRWAQVAGPALALSDPTAAAPQVVLPAGNEEYVFAVQANDGLQYGAPDVVAVRNAGYAGRPIALAGPDRSASAGQTVTLDGSASRRTDGGAAPLAFAWRQVSGRDWFDVDASVPTFDPAAATPRFALPPDVASLTPTRTIVFELVVHDGAQGSAPDLVAVTFSGLPLNGRPQVTAQASDANPVVGAAVTLQGTALDRDGDPLTYRWTQTGSPAVVLSPSATALSPSFTAPDQGTLTFRLVADDGIEESLPAQVTVVVDRKPVASATVSPTTGGVGTPVTIDASASSDPEGHALTFAWTQTSGTSVPFVQGSSVISFNAPAGPVAFRLVVNDGRQDSDPRTVAFTGNPPPTVNPTTDATPEAQAGTYRAPYGATVTLQANPGAGGPFTFRWRVVSTSLPAGVTVSLSSTTAQNPTFSVPAPDATSGPFGQSPSAVLGVVASDGLQQSEEQAVTVNFYASFNDTTKTTTTVYGIVQSRCVSCHSGTNNTCPVGSGSRAQGYGMGSPTAFLTNSRGVTPCATSGKPRLPSAGTTGGSTNSYLFDRVTGSATPRMPTSGGSLTQQELDLLRDWIDQGVQNN